MRRYSMNLVLDSQVCVQVRLFKSKTLPNLVPKSKRQSSDRTITTIAFVSIRPDNSLTIHKQGFIGQSSFKTFDKKVTQNPSTHS